MSGMSHEVQPVVTLGGVFNQVSLINERLRQLNLNLRDLESNIRGPNAENARDRSDQAPTPIVGSLDQLSMELRAAHETLTFVEERVSSIVSVVYYNPDSMSGAKNAR